MTAWDVSYNCRTILYKLSDNFRGKCSGSHPCNWAFLASVSQRDMPVPDLGKHVLCSTMGRSVEEGPITRV